MLIENYRWTAEMYTYFIYHILSYLTQWHYGCEKLEENRKYVKLKYLDEIIYIPKNICNLNFVPIFYTKNDLLIDVYEAPQNVRPANEAKKYLKWHRDRDRKRARNGNEQVETYF